MQSKTNSLVEKLKYLYFLNNPYYISRDVKLLAKKGLKESHKIEKTKRQITEDYPIDFVVTWVDGNDPKWLNEKAKFQPPQTNNKEDNSPARYRDWDNLRYWFRAIEKNAPWFRSIFFVTYGHLPEWLDTSNPKLKIIKHEDYIPKEYLPTYNSRVLELNLWRIQEFSEHFVYFNDDFFFVIYLSESDYFVNGFPTIYAVTKPNKPKLEMAGWDFARYNNCRAFNSCGNIKKIIEQCPEKWFSYKYGKNIKYNIRTYEDGYLTGFVFPHITFSFRKSKMEECFCKLQNSFELTFTHKFRSKEDLNLQIFDMWETMHNTFEPIENFGVLINSSQFSYDMINSKLNDASLQCVCINDGGGIDDESFESVKTMVNQLLQEKYSHKSSFELW